MSALAYNWRERLYDALNNTDTWYIDRLNDLTIQGDNLKYANPYDPTKPRIIRQVLQGLARLGIDFPRFAFVDLGSGKGRVLLAAAKYDFKCIIGVEFAKELHEKAVQNILCSSQSRRCRQVQSLWMDAADFEFPPEPTVLYLYNSFQAPMLAKVLSNLIESLARVPRELIIVSVNPVSDDLLLTLKGIRLAHRGAWFNIYSHSYTNSDFDSSKKGSAQESVEVANWRGI